MNRSILSHKQREWAYARWCEGRTQAEIADALNVSIKTVNRALSGRVRIKSVLVYEEGKE